MEVPELSLGGSLPVPSVQEMVKESTASVPLRYLRPDLEPPASRLGVSLPAIPVIDLRKLLCHESMAEELERLDSACKEWGFFQLINHDISSTLIEAMKCEAQSFFRLPLEEKKKFYQLPGDSQGYGQAFVLSEEQKLDWGDMFTLMTLPTNLRKPHLIERLSPSFRETMEAYGHEMQKLALMLLGLMTRALGLEPEEICNLFCDGLQTIRMNYYPPCPQPQETIGLSPHSDASALTILVQVNQVHGLEVKKDGKWVAVEPLQDAFIVNIGDQLEIVTNGIYESVLHRATVNSEQERLSIATFSSGKAKAAIGPAAGLISAEKPPLFKKVVVEEYIKRLYAGELKGKALVNSLRHLSEIQLAGFLELQEQGCHQEKHYSLLWTIATISPLSSLQEDDCLLPICRRSLYGFEKSFFNYRINTWQELWRWIQRRRVISSNFEDGLLGRRMSYYPPCPQPEQVMGLPPHSDSWASPSSFRLTDLGGSLPVPSVQEMVKESTASVPLRYLRPDLEPPASRLGVSLPAIPVIDLRKLLCHESMADELERLDSACKEWGFFQLINHDISSSLIEAMKCEAQSFFRLPLEEKKKFYQLPGDSQGYGQAFVLSEEQKLDWGDMFSLITLPSNLRKPHLFERLSPSFRETMEAYGHEMQKLALMLLGLMTRALGLEPDEMSNLFGDGLQSMRMNYYPPCPQPEETIGLSPHSDVTALTILVQVNQVHGLEVKKDGKWVAVEPLQDAFIVNIGDQLEIVTNGIYESVLHRATVNSEQERLSIATFSSGKAKAAIGPAAGLISAEKPPVFKKVVVEEYIKRLYAGELKGKALVNSVKITSP
ncbi:hypothetical protein H6P81_014288 [Aristolochia fimbriata]|uniref:Fe2OG dioxygenase domain-containing protein n=1 Tax=Aristolochia fimbriata TaxID=158543 RepID=A0AAV7EH39_ARIFI|nr:hypothetical protein H6P81_014288 [Aristolochia fimbriata]